jgi:hypothetical protein
MASVEMQGGAPLSSPVCLLAVFFSFCADITNEAPEACDMRATRVQTPAATYAAVNTELYAKDNSQVDIQQAPVISNEDVITV